MPRNLSVVEGPANECVSLGLFKTHARISHDDEDEWAGTILLPAAREWCEKHVGRTFTTTTLRLTLDAFPAGSIALPYPPIASVVSVKYDDGANDEQTYSTALYTVEAGSGLVTPLDTWPVTYDKLESVRIEYTAGFGEPADVPAGLKLAVMAVAAEWYLNRESMAAGSISERLMDSVEKLLAKYWTGNYT